MIFVNKFKKLLVILISFVNLNSQGFFKSIIENQTTENCKNNERDFGRTFYSIRPQDSNSMRRILNLANMTKLFFDNEKHFSFNLTLEYQRSFKNNNLARWFFFNGKNCMTVGTPGNNFDFDINANQIGVGHIGPFNVLTQSNVTPGPVGTICINPSIENFIADFEFDFNLDRLLCGLWSRLSFPVVRTQTRLNLCAQPAKLNQAIFKEGFLNFCCSPTKSPFDCLLDAFEGNKPFGAIPKLNFGRFSNKSQIKTGLAGILFDLAYDVIRNDKCKLAIAGHVVFPTGNRPNGRYVFEPIIGANHSWQLGFVVNGMYDIYTPDLNKNVTFFFDSTFSHLFKSNQKRVFGLKNKPGSQLLILKKFDNAENLIDADRVANILIGDVKIGCDIMIDTSLMFQVKWCNYFANFGYNFWFRSKEKRGEKILFNNFAEDTFGLKGDQNLSDVIEITPCPIVEECIPNRKTASDATISSPGNADKNTKFLTISDIDFSLPLNPNSLSNKIFGSIGYSNENRKNPYSIQIGGELEFGTIHAINQWGLFINAEVLL